MSLSTPKNAAPRRYPQIYPWNKRRTTWTFWTLLTTFGRRRLKQKSNLKTSPPSTPKQGLDIPPLKQKSNLRTSLRLTPEQRPDIWGMIFKNDKYFEQVKELYDTSDFPKPIFTLVGENLLDPMSKNLALVVFDRGGDVHRFRDDFYKSLQPHVRKDDKTVILEDSKITLNVFDLVKYGNEDGSVKVRQLKNLFRLRKNGLRTQALTYRAEDYGEKEGIRKIGSDRIIGVQCLPSGEEPDIARVCDICSVNLLEDKPFGPGVCSGWKIFENVPRTIGVKTLHNKKSRLPGQNTIVGFEEVGPYESTWQS